MGTFNSDSGSESILKFVLERKGLSGIILFEHDEAIESKKKTRMEVGFMGLNMASKIPVIPNEMKWQIKFLTNQ